MYWIKDVLGVFAGLVGIADAIIQKRWQVIAVCLPLAILLVFYPNTNNVDRENNSTLTPAQTQTYQQVKATLSQNSNISDVEAYLIDLNADGNNEMVVTYNNNGNPALAIYYTNGSNIHELFNKSATASVSNENPTVCYMITQENNGYSLRERVVQENKTRNTYYRFNNNALSSIRDVYEDDYSAALTELQKYPVVITTDPVHFAVTGGISQPPKI